MTQRQTVRHTREREREREKERGRGGGEREALGVPYSIIRALRGIY
jgi:hypothetical protein